MTDESSSQTKTLHTYPSGNRPAEAMKELLAESDINEGKPLPHKDFEDIACTTVDKMPQAFRQTLFSRLDNQLRNKPETDWSPYSIAPVR